MGRTTHQLSHTRAYVIWKMMLNCRWSTKKENMRNRRNTVFIEFEGQKKSLSEWAEIVGIPWPTIKARIRRGWSVSEALSK